MGKLKVPARVLNDAPKSEKCVVIGGGGGGSKIPESRPEETNTHLWNKKRRPLNGKREKKRDRSHLGVYGEKTVHLHAQTDRGYLAGKNSSLANAEKKHPVPTKGRGVGKSTKLRGPTVWRGRGRNVPNRYQKRRFLKATGEALTSAETERAPWRR